MVVQKERNRKEGEKTYQQIAQTNGNRPQMCESKIKYFADDQSMER